MWHDVLSDARFYRTLTKFDEDLAAEARAAGCPCGGRLHSARYPRKPRGGAADLGAEYEWRFSFCCAEDGCRRRVTPPSVRYLGRRVYLGVVFVLVMTMEQGVTMRRLERLSSHLGLGMRTLRRWRRWWREQFPGTRFWRGVRARFLPPVEERGLPYTLLQRFGGDGARAVLALLSFLGPLTTRTGNARAFSWR